MPIAADPCHSMRPRGSEPWLADMGTSPTQVTSESSSPATTMWYGPDLDPLLLLPCAHRKINGCNDASEAQRQHLQFRLGHRARCTTYARQVCSVISSHEQGAGPLASALLPRNLPWLSSWTCTQWCEQVILTPETWTRASSAAPPQLFGKQGTNPWTVASAQSGSNWFSTTLPGAFGPHFGHVRPAAAREGGPPHQTSALPFLCFAELSDSLGLLVPTCVTSSPSCSSKLGIAAARESLLYGYSRPHLHYPNFDKEAPVSLLRGRRKDDTVVALGSHFCQALDRDLSHHCVFNVKAPGHRVGGNKSVSRSLTKSHGIILCRFERWQNACRQLLLGEIEAANATPCGVSYSGVAAHTVTLAQPGPWRVHVPVRFSTLSPCSKGSTGKQQSSPGRKSEVRYGMQPAFRASTATYLRLPFPQAVRGGKWQPTQNWLTCRLHARFLSV